MKLFVWADPYQVFYGNSMLFAAAETVEEAKELASKAHMYQYTAHSNCVASDHLASALGDPIRILDLPCAEWHEWSG